MNNDAWLCLLMDRGLWHMYVVECSDKTLYTGVTNDVDRRIHEHNESKRGAKYTRSRRPVKLVYHQRYDNRSQAQAAEYKFKKLSRSKKISIIKGI
jgi:putative endonuclease